ncbi:MAG: signal peptide peptidase SppA [Candidatus Delongbacteria bacterium]|nr:signal peptide peptidase SppA [Candidatus Delongbacteria bacterium]MBN2835148.1 signal peptide peptidase SppA [Candidatus Delongbacteria bacterium]
MIIKFLKWMVKTVAILSFKFFILLILISLVFSYLINGDKATTVNDNSVLKISFSDSFDSGSEDIEDISDLSKPLVRFQEKLYAIEWAKFDSRINGIYLDLDGMNFLGGAQQEELNSVLESFKESGKNIYSYGNYITTKSYRSAVCSDSIFMPNSNSALFSLSGFTAEFNYYKDVLEKFGVNVHVIHAGDYKSYGENYSKSEMSPQLRSEIEKIFNARFEILKNQITVKRSDLDNFEQNFLNGDYAMLTPAIAYDKGLIDGFSTEQKILNKYGSKEFISLKHYTEVVSLENVLNTKSNSVAVLYAEGNIITGVKGGDKYISPDELIPEIDKLKENDKVKAVVFRVNSGGGSALSSELIYQSLKELAAVKPLIVSMGDVAASGGYYISTAGHKIFADKYTITGSIGVVAVLPEISKTVKDFGINVEKVQLGKMSQFFSFTTGFDEGALDVFNKRLNDTYSEFRSRVTANRNISDEELENIAGGRIWTGEQALSNGLIDEIGSLNDAINYAVSQSGVTDYSVDYYPEPLTIADKISKSFGQLPFGLFYDKIGDIENYVNELTEFSAIPLYKCEIDFK